MSNLFKLKYLRIIFQIIFFFLYPGLFALTFSQIGSLIFKLTHNTGNFYSLILTILTALVLLIMTALLGRFFCGWMCSFGSMSDFLYYINKKLFKRKLIIKVPEKIDFILKKFKYIILLFILIVFWIMNVKLSFNTDPWKSFANIIALHPLLLTFNFGLLLFIFIVIGDFFIERFFCRYLCPLGAIFVFNSKIKFLRIKKNRDKCGKCIACSKVCSMNLTLHKVDVVKDGDCINCFKCIEICPKKNAKLSIGEKALNTLAIITVSLISFFILYAIKKPATKFLNKKIINVEIDNAFNQTLVANNSNTSKKTKLPIINTTSYSNGTYTGEAFGYNGEIKVAITINSNNIDDIKITQINDTPSYSQQPSILIPQEIISSQSTNINAISGATSTSFGIINAVKNALSKAKKTVTN